jgi:hypothetical protein
LKVDDLREALTGVGLSQSGFARTMIAWGDRREFSVVLRWVQRAVAGAEGGMQLGILISIIRDHLARRDLMRRTLHLLESGVMHTHSGTKAGYADTTQDLIEDTRRQIAELDRLLANCKPI